MQLPENKVEKFLTEFEKLYKTGPFNHSHDHYYIKHGNKYSFLMNTSDISPAVNNAVIKVDNKTLDVFTPSGKKPIGNLKSEFGGLETFDKSGPIHSNHQDRKEARIRQLKEFTPGEKREGLPEAEKKIEPPKENYDYGF